LPPELSAARRAARQALERALEDSIASRGLWPSGGGFLDVVERYVQIEVRIGIWRHEAERHG
jgi:hypothetical protein